MSNFEQYDTANIVADDKAHFLHPWQEFDKFDKTGALPIAEATGAYIYDSDGNQLLDAIGGMCARILVWQDEMAEAIAEQVRQMAYANPMVDMTNIPGSPS